MAIDNGAADDEELHVLALGLLTLLLRAKDGDDVTVEGISKRRKEGREALSGAMRNLVSRAYVVKFKVHGADGKWRTEFTADSIPFTRQDIAEMLSEVSAGALAVRIEPEWIDPRTDGSRSSVGPSPNRPTGTRMSVVTSGNMHSSHVSTTYGKPEAGATTLGLSAAKKIKTEEEEDSLSGTREADNRRGRGKAAPGETSGAQRRQQADPPRPGPSDVVVDAYETALGRPLMKRRREALRRQARELLSAGLPVEWLAARASEMPANGWMDLTLHCERSRVPVPSRSSTVPSSPADERLLPSRAEVEAVKRAILAQGSGL
ncbi:hypothetical protein ACIHFE_33905 [Streptomyces sp. NPDC052396]|uniref:hypothetical protein n=1 Tax=Streptomyces sp. NPDC052396 TaxID=3365689 RepID=UPI0037D1A2D2